MRKCLFLSMFAIILAPVTFSQISVTIGNPTCSQKTEHLPWSHRFAYSESQYGIPEDELALLGDIPVKITKIGWFNCDNPPVYGYSLDVYIDLVPNTYDLSGISTTPYAITNLVATSKQLIQTSNLYFLVLDVPVVYIPGNALIITVCDKKHGDKTSETYWAANDFVGCALTHWTPLWYFDCNMTTADVPIMGQENPDAWATTWFEYHSPKPTHNLTMLSPSGTGSIGRVLPPPGTHIFSENSIVTLFATPNFDTQFDYWEVDGAFYSNDQKETLMMDDEYTVQAFFFRSMESHPLPFYEDFTDVPIGDIPIGWSRDSICVEVADSNKAGGAVPEIRLRRDYDTCPTKISLITPLIDGTRSTRIICSFKYLSTWFFMPSSFNVRTSVDYGITWQYCLIEGAFSMQNEAFINLDTAVGKEFLIKFDYTPPTFFIPISTSTMCIDDIYIGEFREFDMLTPSGQGAVSPPIGHHERPLGYQITLNALPSSTWYAFDIEGVINRSIIFDPMKPNSFKFLGPNVDQDKISAGTWADGTWYVSTIDKKTKSSVIWTVDTADGTMTEVGLSDETILGLAYDEVNDIFYGASDTTLFIVDRTTGSATAIGAFNNRLKISDIAYGNGVLYGLCSDKDSIYTIDIANAELTLLGSLGIVSLSESGMEYDKDHDRLFLTNYGYEPHSVSLLEIDLTTGRAVRFGDFLKNEAHHKIKGLAIPYGNIYSWEFDRWEIDGKFYSYEPLTTVVMDANHTAQAFFTNNYPLGIRLEMPTMAYPGEEFSIIGYFDNPGEPMSKVPTFFIMEAYGNFLFWPSWKLFVDPEHTEIDFEYVDVPTGTTSITVMPPFEWPDTGQDIVTGLGFYGAMLNPEMNGIMGEMAVQEWGYGQ